VIKRVGVFDSGVGGLSVVKSLLDHKLFSQIIYFGDTARVPYGIKDSNTIIRYSLEALEFFKNFDVDMMIAACNSVSAYAIDELKESSNIPICGVIEPGVKALSKHSPNKDASILILGTKATVRSKKYERLLKNSGFYNITSIATSLFVPLVEEEIFEGEIIEAAMNHYFKDIKEPDFIILGCTHFPLLKDAISSYFPNSKLIHSGEAIVEYLEQEYHLSNRYKECDLKLFASENPDHLKKIAKVWL
jgi:glutamate racemase